MTAVLLGLIAGANARVVKPRETTSYTTNLPSSATIVSDWDGLWREGVKYPDSALVNKYGGWVIEVDNEVVLAIDDSFIQAVVDAGSAPAEEDCEEVEDNGKLAKRCNHARCFNSSHCRTYTGCHVCIKKHPRGICI